MELLCVADRLEKAIRNHTLYASFFRDGHPKVNVAYAAYCAAYGSSDVPPQALSLIHGCRQKCEASYQKMRRATIALRDAEESAGLSAETREVPIDELFVGTKKDIYGKQSTIEFHLGTENLHSFVRLQSKDDKLLSYKVDQTMLTSIEDSRRAPHVPPTTSNSISKLLREAATSFLGLGNDVSPLQGRPSRWGEDTLWSPVSVYLRTDTSTLKTLETHRGFLSAT